MHIIRTLQKTITKASESFFVVLLTGPRQVGKTTLLQSLQKDSRSYISLDDFDTRMAAKEDPASFLDRLKLPVLIDEVQNAPELFPYIKMIVDREKKPGLFWLTGSQQFSMMKNVSESLAGRIAILELQGISLCEDEKRPETKPFIPSIDSLKERLTLCKPISIREMYTKIWRGSYPHVVLNPESWELFYASYISTYVERDARDYLKIDNLIAFRKFIQIAAARTGQMLNYAEISKEVGVKEPTIKSWFQVLEATGLIILLQPYSNNLSKRLIKTPKFYFLDTGLCCYLTGWLTTEVLEKGAMSGAMLETYAISEIYKSYIHNGKRPQFYYYLDKDKSEVDLLIRQDGALYPTEIKKSASIRNMHFNGFNFLEKLNTPIGHGCVLCFTKSMLPIKDNIDAVPVWFI